MHHIYYLRGVIATDTIQFVYSLWEINFILNSLLTWNLWDSFTFFFLSFNKHHSFLCERICNSHSHQIVSQKKFVRYLCVSAVWLMLSIYFYYFRCIVFIISLFFGQNFSRQLFSELLSFAIKQNTLAVLQKHTNKI